MSIPWRDAERHRTLKNFDAIAATLTAVPTLCVKLWDAVRARDHGLALDLHRKILPVWNAIFDDNLPANVKYCMELQGRTAGLPSPSMPATSERQAGPIRQALQNAGLIYRIGIRWGIGFYPEDDLALIGG